MNSHETEAPCDRQFLLLGQVRNALLDLREIQRYGTDSYGNATYVSIYGLAPACWYAKGIRLLGRTVVECTRDQLADAMGQDIAKVGELQIPTRRRDGD